MKVTVSHAKFDPKQEQDAQIKKPRDQAGKEETQVLEK